MRNGVPLALTFLLADPLTWLFLEAQEQVVIFPFGLLDRVLESHSMWHSFSIRMQTKSFVDIYPGSLQFSAC